MPYNLTPGRATTLDDEIGQHDGERPRKRPRLSASNPTFQQIALEEIDLEIALRQRLVETIQKRLSWALLLCNLPGHNENTGTDEFRTAALDALQAIEEPCDLIFNRENPLVQPEPSPPINPQPSHSNALSSEAPQLARTVPRSTRTRGLVRAPVGPPKRLLFIRNSGTSPSEIAKLACAQCSRSDFSNLQGLLNHCRLRHKVEYGSHDECVQSCAVLVPEQDRDWVIANGIELGGVSLPSLKRLFEIAVGADSQTELPAFASRATTTVLKAEPADVQDIPPTAQTPEDSLSTSLAQPSAHLTQTLGYHADTPALAPFLGRAPKKRCINVRANEDECVEVEATDGDHASKYRVWRKSYTCRNISRKELDEVIPPDEPSNVDADKDKVDAGGSENYAAPHGMAGTRFHIAARVQVADYSLYVPPKRRPPDAQDHSHRWRITVTSPSYSLPISSVLSTLTVSSITDASPPVLAEPLTVREPPFVVTGTTDGPFLARLTFTWAGTMNPATEIDHWVELDPLQHTSAVLGEEQVFDVELDRHTELIATREEAKMPSWNDDQAAKPMVHKTEEASNTESTHTEPKHVRKLRCLLPSFPMTIRDTKGRAPGHLPYTLVTSPAHFLNLHYGRRKAIEMGRARALRDAYAELVAQESDAVALTVADVFHWLEKGGLFPRPSPPKLIRESKGTTTTPLSPSNVDVDVEAFCRSCGVQRGYHNVIPGENSKQADVRSYLAPIGPATDLFCASFRETSEVDGLPVIDVKELLDGMAAPPPLSSLPHGLSPAIFSARQDGVSSPPPVPPNLTADAVAVAEPRLVMAIQRAAGLPFLQKATVNAQSPPSAGHLEAVGAAGSAVAVAPTPQQPQIYSINPFANLGLPPNPSRATTEELLAPSAVLAVAVRAFMTRLVALGVEEARRQPSTSPHDTGTARASGAAVTSVRHRRHDRARRGGNMVNAAVGGAPGGAIASRENETPSLSPRRRRALTPAHVLAGVARAARASVGDSALLLCIARLGESSLSEMRGGAAGVGAAGEGGPAQPSSSSSSTWTSGAGDRAGVGRADGGAAPGTAGRLGTPSGPSRARPGETRGTRAADAGPVALSPGRQGARRARVVAVKMESEEELEE